MSLENLFIRTKRFIDDIQLDAVIREGHEAAVRVTTNPVELGADITDHSVYLPRVLNLNAQISDTPMGTITTTELVNAVSGLFGSSTESNITRSQASYKKLEALMVARELVTVETRLRKYTNMIITNLHTLESKSTSRVLLFDMRLMEVRIVSTQIEFLSELQQKAVQFADADVAARGTSAANQGRKAAKTVSDTNNDTLLVQLQKLLGGG